MNNGYVQTTCPSCGAAAWGHPQQQTPCNTCGRMVPPMAFAPSPMVAAAPAAPPGGFAPVAPQQAYVAPAPVPQVTQPAPSNPQVVKVQLPYGIKLPINVGKLGKFGVIGVVAVVILASVGFAIFKMKKGGGQSTKKGNLSYSALGLDMKKADPDKMITAVEQQALKWRKDAVWWSINLQWVHADGTVDLSKGGAQVEYISPAGVTSTSTKTREDSIKEFVFGPAGVDFSGIIGAREPWEGVTGGPQIGACGIKDVVKKIDGLTGNKTVRVTFDPQFAFDESWHVLGEDPKVDAYFSMADCSPTKPN